MEENRCRKEATGKDLKFIQLLAHIPIAKKCSKKGICLQTFVRTSFVRSFAFHWEIN